METILLRYFLCMMVVTGLVFLANILILLLREFSLTWREMKAKQNEECQQQERQRIRQNNRQHIARNAHFQPDHKYDVENNDGKR